MYEQVSHLAIALLRPGKELLHENTGVDFAHAVGLYSEDQI